MFYTGVRFIFPSGCGIITRVVLRVFLYELHTFFCDGLSHVFGVPEQPQPHLISNMCFGRCDDQEKENKG
jgi:hypothetical protein